MKKVLLCAAFIAASFTSIAQVGVGTTIPDDSAALDITSTTAGLLPPRMTTANRNLINSGAPAEGLTIYNTDVKCLEFWNGSAWVSSCDNTSTGIIPGNSTCRTATISATPCATVTGATLNDNTSTPNGTEYNWTGATTSGMANTSTTDALVDIGGQCWMRYNMTNIPTNFNSVPTFVPSTDNGWSGYYTGGPFGNEGRLYQWSAAMNGVTTARAQGVCPTDWHIPSDCEWMYLENSLGMSINQQKGNFVYRGSQAQDLSTLVSGGDNSSGFTGLLAGFRYYGNGFFDLRNTQGRMWSSTTPTYNTAFNRSLVMSEQGVYRGSGNRANGYSVRCLKD